MNWQRTPDESVLRLHVGGDIYLRAECYRRTRPARWLVGVSLEYRGGLPLLDRCEVGIGGARGRRRAERAAEAGLRQFAEKVRAAVEG